jgi:hypothetical protein
MTQHGDRSARSCRSRTGVIVVPDRRAERRADPEHLEIAAGHERTGDPLGLLAGAESPRRRTKRQHIDRRAVRLKVLEQRILLARLIGAQHHDQARRVGDRQTPQHERMQDAENRRVGADAERECRDDD